MKAHGLPNTLTQISLFMDYLDTLVQISLVKILEVNNSDSFSNHDGFFELIASRGRRVTFELLCESC